MCVDLFSMDRISYVGDNYKLFALVVHFKSNKKMLS